MFGTDMIIIHFTKYTEVFAIKSDRKIVIMKILTLLFRRVALDKMVHSAKQFPIVPRGIMTAGAIMFISNEGSIATVILVCLSHYLTRYLETDMDYLSSSH